MLGTEQPFFDSKRLPVEPLGLLEVAVPPGDPRKVEEFIKAWEAARLPDDAGGFRVCGVVVT